MKKIINGFFIGVTVGSVLLILMAGSLTLLNLYHTYRKQQDQSSQVLSANIQTSPTPTPQVVSPTPTLNKNPTIVTQAKAVASNPNSGYCKQIPAIFYHHIEPLGQAKSEGHAQLTVDSGWFDKQMSYLASSGYTTITAEQLAQALKNHQNLPGKSIVVTVDDGYADIPTYAYPIAQKYHILLNLMIPTGLLGNKGYMSWDQLKQMVGSGLAFAYDHTWSHASLGKAPPSKIQFEVMTAKKQLEDNLGKPVDIFAYPYGTEGPTVVNFLGSNGFVAAYTTIPGFWQCDSFIMSLHRNRIGNAPLSAYGL